MNNLTISYSPANRHSQFCPQFYDLPPGLHRAKHLSDDRDHVWIFIFAYLSGGYMASEVLGIHHAVDTDRGVKQSEAIIKMSKTIADNAKTIAELEKAVAELKLGRK
jgi:hypothetical protein